MFNPWKSKSEDEYEIFLWKVKKEVMKLDKNWKRSKRWSLRGKERVREEQEQKETAVWI